MWQQVKALHCILPIINQLCGLGLNYSFWQFNQSLPRTNSLKFPMSGIFECLLIGSILSSWFVVVNKRKGKLYNEKSDGGSTFKEELRGGPQKVQRLEQGFKKVHFTKLIFCCYLKKALTISS